jgi:hypothetical protein
MKKDVERWKKDSERQLWKTVERQLVIEERYSYQRKRWQLRQLLIVLLLPALLKVIAS